MGLRPRQAAFFHKHAGLASVAGYVRGELDNPQCVYNNKLKTRNYLDLISNVAGVVSVIPQCIHPLQKIDQNSFLRCVQLTAPYTGLWHGDHQERMRCCFVFFLSTAFMMH